MKGDSNSSFRQPTPTGLQWTWTHWSQHLSIPPPPILYIQSLTHQLSLSSLEKVVKEEKAARVAKHPPPRKPRNPGRPKLVYSSPSAVSTDSSRNLFTKVIAWVLLLRSTHLLFSNTSRPKSWNWPATPVKISRSNGLRRVICNWRFVEMKN